MKSSRSLIGGTLEPAAIDAYVEYLRRFAQAYADQGLPIDALTVQNEPHFSPPGYPGMLLSATQEAEIVHRLGPLLASNGLPTKIVGYDGNWGETSHPLALLGDARANPYLAGTAFHCYSGDPSAQSLVHAAYPDKGIYLTECSGGAWSTDFAANLRWDVQTLVIGAVRHWAKTVVKWNLALDQNHGPTNGGCQDCRGVITVDTVTGDVTYDVEYYSLGHVSKFVAPGAHRIASTTFGARDVESVAFMNANGTCALVVLNGSSQSRRFNVAWNGKSFPYTLPPGAVATFTWSPL
jgi:glucosylceramidase